MKIKLKGKKLYPTLSVKYLEVKTDIKLNWEIHVNGIATKLNWVHAIFYREEILSMQIFLSQSIIHYLIDTLTILV